MISGDESLGEMDLSGNMTRQVEQDLPVEDDSSHIANIGKLVEDMELKMRNLLQEVYFGKAKDVVGDLRSKATFSPVSSPKVLTYRRHHILDRAKEGQIGAPGDDLLHDQEMRINGTYHHSAKIYFKCINRWTRCWLSRGENTVCYRPALFGFPSYDTIFVSVTDRPR